METSCKVCGGHHPDGACTVTKDEEERIHDKAGSEQEISREREKAILEKIVKQASFSVRDNYEFRGDARSIGAGRKIVKNYDDGGAEVFPDVMHEKDINETVVMSPITEPTYRKIPVMRPVYKERWLGRGKRQVGEEIAYHRKEVVSRRPMTHREVIEGGQDEQAYGMQYGLRVQEVGSTLDVHGSRTRLYMGRHRFLLPESVAKEAFELIQKRPEFVREIVKALADSIGKSGRVAERDQRWDTDVFDAWIDKKPQTTKMYIAQADEDGAIEKSKIINV